MAMGWMRPGAAHTVTRTARPRPWRVTRGHRLARALVSLALAGGAFGALAASGPNVSAAPVLVNAIDRAHGSAPVRVSVTSKIALAVIAAEDGHFLTDGAVDLPSLARGAWGLVTGVDSGGSTLEIQLARRLYPSVTGGLIGEARTVAIANALDAHFTKAMILDLYLNAVYWGHSSYGIAAASSGYFGDTPSDLSWTQASLLAGLLQAPSSDDPLNHLALARQRQQYVLGRLVADGYLSRTAALAAAAAPLGLVRDTSRTP